MFLPAVEYFDERRDARWINLIWFLPQERSPLGALTPAQTDVVLKSLLHLGQVESHAERILGLLAQSQPEKVFDYATSLRNLRPSAPRTVSRKIQGRTFRSERSRPRQQMV
jgi:hypothetical protein